MKIEKFYFLLFSLVLVTSSKSVYVNSFSDTYDTIVLPGDSSFVVTGLDMESNNSIYTEIIIANGSEVRYYILTNDQYSSYYGGKPTSYEVQERIYDFSIEVHKLSAETTYHIVFYNPTLQTIGFHYLIKSQYLRSYGLPIWLQIILILFAIPLVIFAFIFIVGGIRSGRRNRAIIAEIIEERKDKEKVKTTLQTKEKQRDIANRIKQQQRKLLLEEKLLMKNKQKALILYNEGMVLKLQLDLDIAEKKFNEALQFDDRNYEIWFGLAETLFQLSRITEALEAYQHSISIKPDHIDSLIAAAALQLLPVSTINKEKLTAAEKLLWRAISIDKNNYLAWNELGSVLKKSGKTQEAQEAFEQADKQKLFNDPRYDYKLSQSSKTIGKFLKDAYKAIRLKDTDKAVSIYLEVLIREPDNQVALTNLGLIYADNKNWSKAEQMLRKALQYDATNIEALEKLRVSAKSQGNVKDLEMISRKFVVIKANDLESWHDLILSLIAQEKYNEANTNCIHILNDYPNYYKFWVLYAIILEKLERQDEVLEVFQRANELDSLSNKHYKSI